MSWFDLLREQPALFYLGAGLLGLIIGSFLNVIILRLPRMLEAEWREQCAELDAASEERPETSAAPARLSLSQPPSSCPHCDRRIRAHENIPVLSYVLLRGRCAGCGGRISLRYPLIELFTALLTLVVAAHFGPSWELLAAWLLSWSLLALAVIDYDTQLLPDRITQPLLWLGLLLSLVGLFSDPQSAILGAAAGYLSLWSVYQLFR
ncbi:MAG: prepilin peptidase, partial [Chromatiaceae bacterium]|nr:prepilin peptidase [Chromatiaceae bacterium]